MKKIDEIQDRMLYALKGLERIRNWDKLYYYEGMPTLTGIEEGIRQILSVIVEIKSKKMSINELCNEELNHEEIS